MSIGNGIEYIDETMVDILTVPVKRTRWGWGGGMLPGQGVDGYGKKIATDRMVRYHGETLKYRVYATCYSNCASHWIVRKGVKLHLL